MNKIRTASLLAIGLTTQLFAGCTSDKAPVAMAPIKTAPNSDPAPMTRKSGPLGANDVCLILRDAKENGKALGYAFQSVADYPGNHYSTAVISNWQNNPSQSASNLVTVEFTSHQEFQSRLPQQVSSDHKWNPATQDAYTSLAITNDAAVASIILDHDKIFLDEKGKKRPDGFIRLTVALAHELYGNALPLLEATAEQTQARNNVNGWRNQEIQAFQASVDFCQRIIQDPHLPGEIRKMLVVAKKREEAGLKSWQSPGTPAKAKIHQPH